LQEMSYATVMVHVDLDGGLSGCVEIAASLADRLGACVIGITGGSPVALGAAGHASAESHVSEEPLEQKRREFYAAVGSRGRGVEWRCLPDSSTDAVVREARAADLIVVGSPRGAGNRLGSLDPGRVIVNAGRPVLVVPEPVVSLVPRRIVIAWKDARESRRALRDALPLLRLAESVMIVEVLEEREGDHALQRVKDVAGYLARHDIEIVTERVRPSDVTITGSLLRLIEDENIDLAVVGAYGHSPLGEFIFGGVTRELLAQSPICCLFSH
jgi:nucleotide-binding universal stress UspA family protein